MEVNGLMKRQAGFEATLPPVLMVEPFGRGWRGLTEDGMILNVESNGSIPLDSSIAVMRNGQHVGYRTLPKTLTPGVIDVYNDNFVASVQATQNNQPQQALVLNELAAAFAPTQPVRYNHSQILLALGDWDRGLDEYASVIESEGSIFMRPEFSRCVELGLSRWRGEDLRGKRLLLIHDHGFGDSIMMLRYVPILKAMDVDVVLCLPPELHRLAAPLAPVVRDPIEDVDYFCSLLFLLQQLHQLPETIPLRPYLTVDPELAAAWRRRIGNGRLNVGVAWLPGKIHPMDFPRSIELDRLVEALPDVNLISVQQHGREDAERLGIQHYKFEDFADCAALMSVLDRIVTVDTAAVHLAGAIGHSKISLLLGHWASWRWRSPLYQHVHVYKQLEPGNWTNVLAAL